MKLGGHRGRRVWSTVCSISLNHFILPLTRLSWHNIKTQTSHTFLWLYVKCTISATACVRLQCLWMVFISTCSSENIHYSTQQNQGQLENEIKANDQHSTNLIFLKSALINCGWTLSYWAANLREVLSSGDHAGIHCLSQRQMQFRYLSDTDLNRWFRYRWVDPVSNVLVSINNNWAHSGLIVYYCQLSVT